VKIQYPTDWSILQNDTNNLDGFNDIVSFHSPLQNSSDRYSENVLLRIVDLGGQNRSLDDYLHDTINYHRANSIDFKIIEASTNMTLVARPAYKLIYDHTVPENNTSLRSMEIRTIMDDRLYAISYNAEPGSYPSYYSAYVLRMIDSFEITRQNQTVDNTTETNMTSVDPLTILDQRLARGEITIEEYERLRGILER
jgi:hypothetical protein